VLAIGVACAPRTSALSGMSWILGGIHRRSSGQMSNLSGKPTNYDRGSEATIDPKRPLKT